MLYACYLSMPQIKFTPKYILNIFKNDTVCLFTNSNLDFLRTGHSVFLVLYYKFYSCCNFLLMPPAGTSGCARTDSVFVSRFGHTSHIKGLLTLFYLMGPLKLMFFLSVLVQFIDYKFT